MTDVLFSVGSRTSSPLLRLQAGVPGQAEVLDALRPRDAGHLHRHVLLRWAGQWFHRRAFRSISEGVPEKSHPCSPWFIPLLWFMARMSQHFPGGVSFVSSVTLCAAVWTPTSNRRPAAPSTAVVGSLGWNHAVESLLRLLLRWKFKEPQSYDFFFFPLIPFPVDSRQVIAGCEYKETEGWLTKRSFDIEILPRLCSNPQSSSFSSAATQSQVNSWGRRRTQGNFASPRLPSGTRLPSSDCVRLVQCPVHHRI